MSTTGHHHAQRPTEHSAELRRPQYVPRRTWDRMSPAQRAAAQRRAAAPTLSTLHVPDDVAAAGLSAGDLAILRPLGKLATVHDMAERLSLPTPPHTTTAEEADR